MLRPMPKKDTAQFNLRPARELVNRLAELSQRFKRDSANQVAVEILRDYIELWADAEQAKYDTIRQQQERFSAMIKGELLRHPLHEGSAVAEAATKSQIPKRKERK